jgi:tetratricopeptide (TPR) repeat protein
MIDFLSNAMLNPIYPLAIGGLLCQQPFSKLRLAEVEENLNVASELLSEGLMVDAEAEFRRLIDLSPVTEDLEGWTLHAQALDGLGLILLATERCQEAEIVFREALVTRDQIAAEFPDHQHFADLAIAREGLSRALVEVGRTSEAIEERRIALEIWNRLVAYHPRLVSYRDHRANALNDLAWLLVTDPDHDSRDPAQALDLAEEAVRISTDQDAFRNTLGVARYRAGDWTGAIDALERSALSSPGGLGTAFDHYFLAMAWCQLRHEDQAREWLERGIAWTARHRPGHLALERFREEVESLLRDG